MGQDITRLEEKAVGLFAYFAENGTQTDDDPALTISPTVLPDADPTTNWKSLGSILEGAKKGVETIDDSYMKLVGDKFVKMPREIVVSDYLDFETRQMNQLVDAMMYGVPTDFSEDDDIAPFQTIDRNAIGWLLLQTRKLGSGGVDDNRIVCWVDLRLPRIPDSSGNKVQKPGLRAQFLPNALNSLRFLAPA